MNPSCHVSAPRGLCAPSSLRLVVSAPRGLCAPSFLLLMASLAVSLLLFLSAAEAGTYTVTYSGGTFSNYGDKDPYIEDYAVGSGNSASSYGDRGFNTADAYGDEDAADVSGSGAITAVFTWQPDSPGDLPPSCAVVQQSSDVFAGSDGIGTGSLDDGFGDTVSVPEAGGNELTKTQYSVKTNPGSSFQVQCSPSADSGGAFADVSAGVSYTAAAYPVTVTLGGTTKDGSGGDNILIGQGCSATLSAGPCSLSDFQWNPGGAVFSQFAVASDQSTGQVIPVADGTWQQANPYWHYLQDSGSNPFSVTCSATASMNGTVIGTVTGQRSVQVWVPYYFMGANVNPCTIVGDLMQAGGPDTSSTPGINFTGRVGTPALFRSGGGASSSACGFGAFLQLCSLNENLYSSVAATQTNATNGYELDNIWPFYGQFNANSTDATPNSASAPDSPGLDVNVFTDKVGVTDDFQMYLMYQPPGNDAQWVPLDRLAWHWYIDTTEVGSQWIPTPPGTVVADPDKRWMVHPEWTSRYTNTAGQL